MSFILDALTRSERERQRKHVPGVHTVHFPPAAEPVNREASRYLGVGAAVLVSAGLLAWWLWQTPPTDVAIVHSEPPAQTVATRPPEPVDTSLGRDTLASIESSIDLDTTAAASVVIVERPVVVERPATETPASEPLKLETDDELAGWTLITPQTLDEKTRAAAPAVAVDSSSEGPIYGIRELPDAVRADLPEVVFSGHMYSSDPAARMIIVDGSRAVTEGHAVADELILEEITNDGVIMVFRGYRFSAGVVGNWALR